MKASVKGFLRAHRIRSQPISIFRITHAEGSWIMFPASGNRNGTSLNNRGSNGNYWSSSLNSSANGYNMNFNSGGVNPANNNNRFNGFSVRAVQHLSTNKQTNSNHYLTQHWKSLATNLRGNSCSSIYISPFMMQRGINTKCLMCAISRII